MGMKEEAEMIGLVLDAVFAAVTAGGPGLPAQFSEGPGDGASWIGRVIGRDRDGRQLGTMEIQVVARWRPDGH